MEPPLALDKGLEGAWQEGDTRHLAWEEDRHHLLAFALGEVGDMHLLA